ncbi:sugar kinase [Ramlibacter albus]|uniref:Sugar kinase n=1 Tax=Ramlibacter albus TaxID=2079448 RepID=A0A923M6X5_9BURK|nr:sugar kinase [Ramlibacter albus]MBC5764958.1 sugar kinase [Ramlibacter albus]
MNTARQADAARSASGDRRVVLVTRRTRLDELVARHNTVGQAKFYVETLGADFGDYLRESEAYAAALRQTTATLQEWGRWQSIDRTLLANFVFAPDDIVVALGQDGVVANTMKYLDGQPLVGVNPEASRWDGVLLPFRPQDLKAVIADVAAGRRPLRSVTMAEARMSDGQVLRAVNDLFIGPRGHTSALYDLTHEGHTEFQSSSGLIVSTGLGSTAWMKSIVTGSMAIAHSVAGTTLGTWQALPWDTPELVFAVREPFPTRTSSATLVYGTVAARHPLVVRSRMPESGVIFSDGMEADFLRFTAGLEATIAPAASTGRLVS